MRREEVEFSSGSILLSGTLMLPENATASSGLVLIGGSGPTDRRNDGFFDLLSDDLVQEGIAVLAFDKRGTGRSTGRWETATIGELADDADAALTALEAHCRITPRPSPCSGTARVAGLQPGYAAENDSAGA